MTTDQALKDRMDETGDPSIIAEQFARTHHSPQWPFDFTLRSLETDLDQIIVTPLVAHGLERPTETQERAEAALCAYLGETLRRLFDGDWRGTFHPACTIFNYYRSFIVFGDYRFNPHGFVGYRLKNGTAEGTVKEYVTDPEGIISRIRARQDVGGPNADFFTDR